MSGLAKRLSFANVMSVVAVFIALGGSALAISKNSVGSKQLKAGAVKNSDVADGAIDSAAVLDGSLDATDLTAGTLAGGAQGEPGLPGPQGSTGPQGPAGSPDTPQQVLDKVAQVDGSGSGLDADRIDGMHAVCPANTVQGSGLCFETTARAGATWGQASDACKVANGMLPSADQLRAMRSELDLGANSGAANWTSNISEDDDGVGDTAAAILDSGGIFFNSDPSTTNQPYRCVFLLVR